MKYIYLDTSALRDLAKYKAEKYWIDIDQLLRDGNHTLFLSTTHMYEFSKGRKEHDNTALYLGELPFVKWIIPPWFLWREEIKDGLNYCLTNKKSGFCFYYDLFFEMYTAVNKKYKMLKYYIGQPVTPSEVIDFFKKDQIYEETEKVASRCAEMVRKIRENSLIWTNPAAVLRIQIRQFWPTQTNAKLTIRPDDNHIDRVIEISNLCMPSLVFITNLQRIKFSKREYAKANDFIDEFHASYAPYCDVIMHDKKACKRIRKMDSEYVMRFAAEPLELLDILKKPCRRL